MPELEPARSPDRHCLLIDQGSSRVKWISAVHSAIADGWSLDLTTLGSGLASDLDTALQSGELMPPEEILICSVGAPASRTKLRNILARHSSAKLVELTSEVNTAGIQNGYLKHQELGADRWMAIVGAAVHHGLPGIVMDLGTATTLDAIDQDGNHLGGLIFPGPGTMLDSLGRNTALATDNAGDGNSRSPGAGEAGIETTAAIYGGTLSAQIGALGQFLDWFRRQSGSAESKDPVIVVTGGAAGVILGKSGYLLIHDPLVVFKGMLICRYGTVNDSAAKRDQGSSPRGA